MQAQISPFEIWLINIAVQVFNWLVIAAIIYTLKVLHEGFRAIRAAKKREFPRGVEKDKVA